MGILTFVLNSIYIISCILLIVLVLMQSGKGGGIAAAFGGGGGVDSAFGAQVGGPLRKATGILAAIFLGMAIVIAVVTSVRTAPIDEELLAPPEEEEMPAGVVDEADIEDAQDIGEPDIEGAPDIEDLEIEAPAADDPADAMPEDVPQVDETFEIQPDVDDVEDDTADDEATGNELELPELDPQD